jgi:hypothetical protein
MRSSRPINQQNPDPALTVGPLPRLDEPRQHRVAPQGVLKVIGIHNGDFDLQARPVVTRYGADPRACRQLTAQPGEERTHRFGFDQSRDALALARYGEVICPRRGLLGCRGGGVPIKLMLCLSEQDRSQRGAERKQDRHANPGKGNHFGAAGAGR